MQLCHSLKGSLQTIHVQVSQSIKSCSKAFSQKADPRDPCDPVGKDVDDEMFN